MNKIAKTLLMAVAIPLATLAQTARPMAEETETCFGKIHLNREVYSFSDPLGIEALKNLELGITVYEDGETTNTTLHGSDVIVGNGQTVTINAPYVSVSDRIVVGHDNSAVVSNANIIGNGNRVGVKGWYYSGIVFTTNGTGAAVLNQPATFFLTDDAAQRNTGNTTTNLEFASGFSVGEYVSIVNNSKYDMQCKVTAVNGNAVEVDKIPFTEIVEPPNGREDDDFAIIQYATGTNGCVEFSESSFVAGQSNTVYRKAGAAFGKSNTVYGDYGFAGGRNGEVGYAAGAFGAYNKALAWYSFAEGYRNEANQWYSHAGGDDSKATGYSSFAHGHQAFASGDGAVAFGGVYVYDANGWLGGTATGNGSFAAGIGSKASGLVSLSIGSNTTASASYSVALGNSTTASGSGSFAVGALTTSSGDYSSSFGYNCKASGKNSIAGGAGTQATNEYSVAFGLSTKAYGGKSMAIGNGTLAIGTCSFAGGVTCTNNGTASFVFGSNCSVEKNSAAAIGGRLIVSNDYETVVGQWNKPVAGNRFSVGIGSNNNTRKNAFEVRSSGNIYMSANPDGIYISGTNLTQTIKAVVLDAVQNDQQFRDALRAALNQ